MSTPSLLCVPYRLKAGTLYSQIPDSGLGDFVVTRATTPTAGQATRVNSRGLIETVLDNVPRLDYPLGGITAGCPALLVEPSATNSMFYSQSINSWPTKTGLTITDNNAISPDGTQNASYIQQTIGGATVSLVSAVVTVATAQPQSVSFYAKAGQVTSVTFQLGTPALWVGSTRVRFTIDLLTGAISVITGTGTASSVAVGNGWYKYSVVTAATIGSGTTSIQTVTGAIFSPNSGDGFYLWGAQWEQNSLVPTSYIPTTTAAITRGAETISKTGVSSLIGQTEGTIYAELDFSRAVGTIAIILGNGSSENFRIRKNANFSVLVQAVNTSGSASLFTSPAASAGIYKIAFGYKNGDYAMSVNGAAVLTSNNSVNFPVNALDRIFLGDTVGGVPAFNDRIRDVALYPTRLPNTGPNSLQSLTQ